MKRTNTQRQETEVVTVREKVGEGATKNIRTKKRVTLNEKKEGNRRMIEETDTETKNTFSVLQEEDTEPLLEEKEPLKLTK